MFDITLVCNHFYTAPISTYLRCKDVCVYCVSCVYHVYRVYHVYHVYHMCITDTSLDHFKGRPWVIVVDPWPDIINRYSDYDDNDDDDVTMVMS